MKTITVELEIEAPEQATKEDIEAWVNHEYQGHGINPSNPCYDKCEISWATIKEIRCDE